VPVQLCFLQAALPEPGGVSNACERPHQVVAMLEGRHLLPEEGGDDMAGHDALAALLRGSASCHSGLPASRALGSAKRGSSSSNRI
jgi:hypothetical protein